MATTPDEAVQWIARHRNQPLRIVKREANDRDEIRLELDEVEVRRSRRYDPENYTADEAIVLRGSGLVIADGGTAAPLPLETYEIPLDVGFTAQESGNGLIITNERADYSISPIDRRA
jgi:hypothetical protein